MTAAGSVLPKRIAVCGGGTMGAGIAQVFLAAGARVAVVEGNARLAETAHHRLVGALEGAYRRGRLLDPLETILPRLTCTSDVTELAGADLVVEAVPEHLALKRRVLASAAEVAPEAVLATNTSALSIDLLARGLPDPSRFLGLHFFNPVPASALVEIVTGSQTSGQLVTDARGWVDQLGKVPIVVRDTPGFASSRLGVVQALEAMRMLGEGVATAEEIDAAMTLGYRHPIGPLRTTDLIGLDVRLAIAEHLERELGERFRPPVLLRQMVAAGHLGRKTGRGFYTW